MGKRWRRYVNGPYRLGRLKGQAVVTWRDGAVRHRVRLDAWTEPEGRALLDAFAARRERLKAEESRTIAEIYAAYQADRAKDGKIIENFKESWKALGPKFGLLTPDDIDADLCRSYAAERIASGKSQGTVWTELIRLRSALNWALKRRIIKSIPYVWVPMKPPPRNRVLTIAEVKKLLASCVMPHVKLFAILALTTGGRTEAILELTWDRVDFEGGTIDLRIDAPSNPLSKAVRKGRAKVPMTRIARAALQEAQSGALTDNVIEWSGCPIKNIRKGFSEAVRRAGLGSDVTPHVLRHTAASWMEGEDVPMGKISRFLGHKDERTTRTIYAKPDTHSLQKAARVVDLAAHKSRAGPRRTS